jgi:hypothetical protein
MIETQAILYGLGDVKTSELLTHPAEVIASSELSKFEKRVIHANWASDARTIEDTPELRQLDNGTFVRIDTALNALRLWIIQGAISPGERDRLCSPKECTHRCRRPDFRSRRRSATLCRRCLHTGATDLHESQGGSSFGSRRDRFASPSQVIRV